MVEKRPGEEVRLEGGHAEDVPNHREENGDNNNPHADGERGIGDLRAVVCILRKFMYVNSATKKKIQATSGTARGGCSLPP